MTTLFSEPKVERTKTHTRQILIEGYKRQDGLWDIEGYIKDVKTHDHKLVSHVHPANKPIHEMTLRITIDNSLTIVEAEAMSHSTPYSPVCERITPEYAKLKGVQIKGGFRSRVAELFGGTKGCTHITELIGTMATAAIQTTVGNIPVDPAAKPLSVNGCHALDTSGSIVQEYYPQWYKKKE